MGQRTQPAMPKPCTVDGCAKPHLAKGYCSTHYSQRRHARLGPNTGKKQFSCGTCGKPCWKQPRPSLNYLARYCSTACLAAARQRTRELVGPVDRAWCDIPKRHPARRPTQPARAWVSGRCRHCDAWFVDRQAQARFCSQRCTRRWHKNQRKALKGQAVPAAVRAQVYQRDAGTCQLCFRPVDMTLPHHHPQGPTLDHIECQSWVLIPDHTARNLRLAHRDCNSARGDRIA